MKISENKALAVRTHAAAALRAIGVRDLADYEPHTRSWSDLNLHERDVRKICRDMFAKGAAAGGDDNEGEAKAITLAQNALADLADEIACEKDLRSAAGNRGPRSHGGDPRRPVEDREEGGGSTGDEPVFALRSDQRFAAHIARRGAEDHEGLSTGAYLRAMVLGAKTDAEKRALSEGSDSAGGYTVPTLLSADMIDRMRSASVAIRAGARTVPLVSNSHHIAKVATDPVPAWRAEAGAIAESSPTFALVSFDPKSLAVLVKVSREILQDSLNIERVLPEILTAAMGLELDRVALFGSGTGEEPAGVVTAAGINVVALGGELASYAPLVQARTKVLVANSPDVTGYVMHPRDDGALAELCDTTGQPLRMPKAIEDKPFLTTTAVPADGGDDDNESTILTGYWPKLLIGLRESITITVLKERYADTGQYGFIAHLRADVAWEHDAAFTKITGITPAA